MGQTIQLRVGERFVLALDEGYDWTVTVANPAVVSASDGAYEARQAGQTDLIAEGDPPCRKVVPPCGLPSRLFQVLLVVLSDGQLSLTATPSVVAPNGSVTVSWDGLNQRADSYTIALYQVGAPDEQYLDYWYTINCSHTRPDNLGLLPRGPQPIPSGSCSFPLLRTSGSYEFRLFYFARQGGRPPRLPFGTLLAMSNTVTIHS
jgi:hypothetical protein